MNVQTPSSRPTSKPFTEATFSTLNHTSNSPTKPPLKRPFSATGYSGTHSLLPQAEQMIRRPRELDFSSQLRPYL